MTLKDVSFCLHASGQNMTIQYHWYLKLELMKFMLKLTKAQLTQHYLKAHITQHKFNEIPQMSKSARNQNQSSKNVKTCIPFSAVVIPFCHSEHSNTLHSKVHII